MRALDPFGAPQLGPATHTNLGNNQITGVEFYLTKEAAYGLSGSLSITYQNEFSNVAPDDGGRELLPVGPAGGARARQHSIGSDFSRRSSDRSRSTIVRVAAGGSIPTIFYNHGYPIGSGLLTAAPSTECHITFRTRTRPSRAARRVGRRYPVYRSRATRGSIFAPNIAARRGTPETASPGGTLSVARFFPVQLTFEFTPPRNQKNTFGVDRSICSTTSPHSRRRSILAISLSRRASQGRIQDTRRREGPLLPGYPNYNRSSVTGVHDEPISSSRRDVQFLLPAEPLGDSLRKHVLSLGAAVGTLVLAACTGGQSAIEPPSRAVDVQGTTAAQFRVGTAAYSAGHLSQHTRDIPAGKRSFRHVVQYPDDHGTGGFVVPAAGRPARMPARITSAVRRRRSRAHRRSQRRSVKAAASLRTASLRRTRTRPAPPNTRSSQPVPVRTTRCIRTK